jgi:hypothetical protein
MTGYRTALVTVPLRADSRDEPGEPAAIDIAGRTR